MLKVIEKEDWHIRSGKILKLEEVLPELLCGNSERGSIEQMEADIEAIRSVLIRFLQANISSVEQLNILAGYERFKEASNRS